VCGLANMHDVCVCARVGGWVSMLGKSFGSWLATGKHATMRLSISTLPIHALAQGNQHVVIALCVCAALTAIPHSTVHAVRTASGFIFGLFGGYCCCVRSKIWMAWLFTLSAAGRSRELHV